MSDLSLGETLEDGVDLGDVSKTLEKVGVSVLDANGNLRDMGTIIEDLMVRWNDFGRAEQNAIAQQIAGKYQYNRFITLMENQEMYQETLENSLGAEGFLEKTQEIYSESINAKLKQLQVSWEGLITELFDGQNFTPFIEGLSDAISLVQELVKSIGGLGPVLTGLGAIATKVFQKQIASGITNILDNRQMQQMRASNAAVKNTLSERGLYDNLNSEEASGSLYQLARYGAENEQYMTQKQAEAYNVQLEKSVQAANNLIEAQDRLTKTVSGTVLAYKLLGESADTVASLSKAIKEDGTVDLDSLNQLGDFFHEIGDEGIISPANKKDFADAMQDLAPRFAEVRSSANAASQAIGEIYTQISQMDKATAIERMKQALDDMGATSMISEIAQLGQGAGVNPIVQRMGQIFLELSDDIEKTTNDGGASIDQLKQKLDNLLRTAIQFSEIAQNPEKFVNDLNGISKDYEKAVSADQYKKNVAGDTTSFIDSVEMTKQISQVVELTQAVQGLAFGFQAFSALPNLWNENDVSLGEKLTQTIINLSTVLMTVGHGWLSVRKVLSSPDGLTKLIANLRTAGDQAAIAGEKAGLAGIKARLTGTAFKGAATGVSLFGQALNFLTGPVGIVLTILGTAIASLDSFSKAAKEAATSNALEKADESISKLEETQSKLTDLQPLREEYEKTGVASDDLVNSLKEIGEALGITDTSVLASIGNYDSLIEKIDDATRAAKENAVATAAAAKSALSDEMSSNEGIFGLGGSKQLNIARDLFGDAVNRTTTPIFKDPNLGYASGNVSYIEQESYQSDLAKQFKPLLDTAIDNKDFDAVIGILNDIVAKIDKNEDSSESDKALRDQAVSLLADEKLQQYASNSKNAAQGAISLMEFDENATAEQIYNEIANNADVSSFFLDQLTTDSDRYAFILENLSNEINKSAVELGFAKSRFMEDFTSKTVGLEDASGNIVSEEKAQQVGQGIVNRVENSELSQEDKIRLLAGIDWEKSLPQINNEINQAVESGSIDSIQLKGEYDASGTLKSSYVDDDELEDLLTQYNISEETFDTFQDQIRSQGAEQNSEVLESARAYNEKAKAQEESAKADYEAGIQAGKTADELEELENAYRKAQRQVQRSSKAEKASEQNLRDVTAAAIKSGAALDDLSENFEDYEKILKSADKNSLQYAETMATVREDVAGMLGVDFESIDSQFVEDNLDSIREAANGSEEAVNSLRVALATDIVGKMDIEGPDPEATRAELLGLIDDLRNLASSTPIGVEVDVNNNEAFIKLNELLAAGAVTGEQMNQYLNSVGFKPNIEKVSDTVHSSSTGKFYLGGDGNYGTPSIEIPWSSEMDMSVEVPQITGAESIEGAQIAGIGARSPRSAANAGKGGGGSKKGGGGGSKKGGGGSKPKSSGSGSGKTYDPKTKEKIEEDIDRYERVNAQLEGVGNDLEKINKEEDRLTGWKLADNFKEQNKLLTKQIALHEQKLAIQKEEARELKNELASQFGITFDAEGYIQNYAATHRKLEQDVNNIINQYNATTTESGQEALEKQIDAAQKRLDKFKEKYQRYDELFAGEMRETINTIEDLKDEIEDLNITLFDKAVDAADTIKEIQEAYIEFSQVFSGRDSDDPFRGMETSAQKLTKYFDVATKDMNKFYDTWIKRTQQLQKEATTAEAKAFYGEQIKNIQNAQKAEGNGSMELAGSGYLDMAFSNLSAILKQLDEYEANNFSSIFGENQAALYETAKNVFDQATSMIMDFEAQIEELRDNIIDAIDDIGERMDERIEQYEFLNDQLEHQLDILEMIKGDRAYDDQNMILAAQNENYLAQIKNLREYLSILEDLKASLEEGTDEWKAVQEKITEAQENINDLVVSSLEVLTQQYENTVNKVLDNWTSSPFGNDLDWIAQEWELINRNADYYLDATNKAYSIQKLQDRYLEMLDGTNDLHIQQQITDQMNQQLGYLRDKKNLSEYDVQYANMQLEILQKTIALEEARNNKNQMKLRRDAQGNYSYVYTADEGDVKKAEDDLLDARQNAYNLSKEQMKQTQADSLSALQDARSLLDSIWNDANLSLEEKKKRTQTIIDSLKEYLDGTSEQLSTSEMNIINDFIGMVEMMTDENAANLKDVYDQIIAGNVDAFDQIDTRWSTSITTWLQNLEEFNESTNGMFEDLITNAEDFDQGIADISGTVGSNLKDVEGAVNSVKDATADLNQETQGFFNQLKDDSGIVRDHAKTLEEYRKKIADVSNEMKAYQSQVADLQDKLTAKEKENATLAAQITQLTTPNNSASGGANGGGSGGSKGQNARAGDIVGFKGQYFYDSQGKRPLGSLYAGRANAVRISSFSGSPYGNGRTYGGYKVHIEDLNGGHLGWIQPSQLFDTGGFTGSWSGSGNADAKDGKLAWLHQKELVLNETDTSNILAAVSVVRDIAETFKSAFSNSFGGFSSFGSVSTNAGMDVDQNVHITAEFPNVSSSSEIEEALLGLNDRAVQYAFKTM